MDSAHITRLRETPWATFREAERYARVGDGVIRAAAERGEIPCYRRKGGKGAIVSLDDVDRWIRSTWVKIGGTQVGEACEPCP